MEGVSVWRRVDGGRVHEVAYDHADPGATTYVLVHGLGVSGRYFTPLAERLAGSARVYVPDLPGNGRSERPPRPLDIPGLAAALGAWADAAGVDRACFVGNSLGCQTVVELAVARPELVERLVLIGPTVDPAARSLPRQLGRFVTTAVHEPRSLVALVLREYVGAGLRRTLATGRYALADDVDGKLGRVRAPTLVIRGEHDSLCPASWAARIAGRVPDGRVAVVAGASHAANFSHPDEVARLVARTPDDAAAVSRA